MKTRILQGEASYPYTKYKAADELDGNVLLMDSDVYFEAEVLQRLVKANQENLIAIDTTSSSFGEEVMVGFKNGRASNIKRSLVGNYDLVGEVVGFYKFNRQACVELKKIFFGLKP